MDRSGQLQRLSEVGFAAYLTKPVRTRELMGCLAQVLARTADDWQLRSQPLITRNMLIAQDSAQRYEGKVLLVEDNAINQRVGRKFLERLGCTVRIAENGAQALEAFGEEAFALILMDMEMPVMDGLEATRRIRASEGQGQRTPIVALTANAMMAQLERCLEAGMDNYLTKPLDIARLQDVLDTYIGGGATGTSTTVVERALTAPATHLADVRRRLAEVSGADPDFESELIDAFIASGDQTMEDMRIAIATGDLGALSRAAHRFKGACANLHIEFLASLAQEIEAGARAGATRDWPADLQHLTAEFKQACAALRSPAPADAADDTRAAS
jgi:CheY-like chemotaxis protein/HPt (histidine-containing phosphotransfer) domain-containing protein